jgi:hypothetical protein
LERCAEEAPEGTYEDSKKLAEFVGEMSNTLLRGLRDLGLKVCNDDRLREVEAVIYGYIKEANPEAYFLIVAEGFGEHIDGAAAARIKQQAARDRDALRSLGVM